MIEFNKIFCDLHPNELVSNYCSHQQCNVGLCATCICSHTETHVQRRTVPEYENIRTTFSKMQDSLRSRISSLEHQKSRINLLIENIHSKRQNITELICQARHQSLDMVNKFYDAKQKEILRKVEADEKKLGLHNENRMDTLLNMISRDVNSLFAAAQDLNSQNFLQSFNRIRTQVLTNSLQSQKDISEELQNNQNYEVALNINPLFMNDIKQGLEKSLILVWENKKVTVSAPLANKDSRETSTNRSSRIMVMNQSQIMNQNQSLHHNQPQNQSQNRNQNQPQNQNQNQNQSSGVNIHKRSSESLPKQSFSNHPTRCTSTVIPPYYMKPAQPIAHYQPQLLSSSFTLRPQPHISNNSMPVQVKPNVNSRMEVRVNSSEKSIKENGHGKHPLTQSYMESNFNHLSTPQLDATKKIRKSGLSVLRNMENQKN